MLWGFLKKSLYVELGKLLQNPLLKKNRYLCSSLSKDFRKSVNGINMERSICPEEEWTCKSVHFVKPKSFLINLVRHGWQDRVNELCGDNIFLHCSCQCSHYLQNWKGIRFSKLQFCPVCQVSTRSKNSSNESGDPSLNTFEWSFRDG